MCLMGLEKIDSIHKNSYSMNRMCAYGLHMPVHVSLNRQSLRCARWRTWLHVVGTTTYPYVWIKQKYNIQHTWTLATTSLPHQDIHIMAPMKLTNDRGHIALHCIALINVRCTMVCENTRREWRRRNTVQPPSYRTASYHTFWIIHASMQTFYHTSNWHETATQKKVIVSPFGLTNTIRIGAHK